jgi:SpoVK/Ycf46/Vps4 family AAA+-type ATPase
MRLINCIAGVIMSRAAIVFSDGVGNFWGEYTKLEKFCKSIKTYDFENCMHEDRAVRYAYIADVVLEGNRIALDVLDLSIAQMLFPEFGVLLRRYTGYGACILNGCRIEGYDLSFDGSPNIGEMHEAYRLLSILFDTEEGASFFQSEHLCDNRIIAFINGDNDKFLANGISIIPSRNYREGNVDSSFVVVSTKKELAIKKAYDHITVRGMNMVCFDAILEMSEKTSLDKRSRKTLWEVVREAVIYRGGIFVVGITDKNYKVIINALGTMTKNFNIPWGIEMPKEVYFSIKPLELDGFKIIFEDNVRQTRKVQVPSGVLLEPDKYITMDDLIIPQKQKEILGKICNHVKYEKKVYFEWGMDVKYRYGKGTPVLFAGPPGTGKTMAAHVLSNMLNIPLYKVDLSQVADKYIGETEKHLSKIFDYADENETLLFFDEADSLFGKRSEVKDSKDRYANMEISYILQRIEQFDGIAILATNLRENMDSAFIRRMKYIVDFIMPNKEMRYQIWKNAFSNQVPTKDVDFEYLAEQFELSGGNIKNIVLTATFMAAGKNTPVNMGCLLEAVENEYSKYNKKMTIKDYGKYGYLAI